MIGRLIPPFAAALLLVVATTPAGANEAPARDSRFALEIRKASKVMLVKAGDHIERRFAVAVGSGGAGDKQRVGDNKTPVGVYRVVGFRANSAYHYFIQIGYPNIKDAFQGLKNQIISQREFDRIVSALKTGDVPPQNTALGGSIGIHGIGEMTPDRLTIHQHIDWTHGCIALTNNEVMDLTRYVRVGTRVLITD
ncbi:MAG: L,D-transpeptidase family protein [Gammaproteobacteria bacterium]|nr:L,D-transpeptidase family protein [Gammaproteobacteria bacterium]